MSPPYFKLLGNIGHFRIWLVSGDYIRDHYDIDFTNFGHHHTKSYIPQFELWIDDSTPKAERRFFIDRMLTEYRLMNSGMSYERAVDQASMIEEAERAKGQTQPQEFSLAESSDIYKKYWIRADDVLVWIVDGQKVRSRFNTNFVLGGHGYIYPFIPQNEIWIEDAINDDERQCILVHELYERYLMQRGWSYERAHYRASQKEYYYRASQ